MAVRKVQQGFKAYFSTNLARYVRKSHILSHLLVPKWLPILKISEDNLRVYSYLAPYGLKSSYTHSM
jgi:hypothetical protein